MPSLTPELEQRYRERLRSGSFYEDGPVDLLLRALDEAREALVALADAVSRAHSTKRCGNGCEHAKMIEVTHAPAIAAAHATRSTLDRWTDHADGEYAIPGPEDFERIRTTDAAMPQISHNSSLKLSLFRARQAMLRYHEASNG